MNLVTFSDGKLAEVTPLIVPITQALAVIKGDFDSISAQLAAWEKTDTEATTWLDIEITSDEYLHDIQRKIQTITDELPVEVLLVRRSREQRQRILESQTRETLSELSIEEVFQRRLALETLEEPQQQRLQTLFNETLNSLGEEQQP